MQNNDLDQLIDKYKQVFSDHICVKYRRLENANAKIKACIIFSEGMIIPECVSKTIVKPIQNMQTKINLSGNDLLAFMCLNVLTSEEVSTTSSQEKIVKAVYTGDTVILVDSCNKVIIVTSKGWETRAIEEPKGERLTQGPQEGFTEAAIINMTLIKRRIISSDLKFKTFSVGNITKTDIYISYIDKIVSPDLLELLEERIKMINIDAVLDSNYISECISDNAFSGFSLIGYTERPDIIAAKLLEGKIAIICNGSPDVLIVPHLFYENLLCNEDYYYNYLFAIFNRFIRLLAFFITSSISAIYLALVTYHQHILPSEVYMSIASAREGVPFQTLVELIIMLVTFEILREAGTRLSLSIGQAISIVGAIVLGEAAVSARLISAPIVIITGISGITSLMLPRVIHVLVFIRFGLLIFSSLFGLYGYIFGVMGIVAYMMTLESFGINYMGYVNNPGKSKMKDVLVRAPWNFNKNNGKNITSNVNSTNSK